MKQNWIWVILVVVALVAGYFGGQALSAGGVPEDVKKQIATLEQDIKGLKEKLANPANSGGKLRMAYLDANAVFTQYKGTQGAVEQFKAEREKKQEELQKLKKDFESAKLSSKDYEEAVQKLTQELQVLDLRLTSEIQKKMLDVIKKLGQERGYDWVTQRKDVVLYVKDGVMDEITFDVLSELNKQQ
jgi:Skp family chaperone for outer membrane proteins